MRNLLSSFAVLALTVGASAQTTWFVDPAGSNANAGTAAGPANAFETINHANSVASSGDVVILSAGNFGAAQGIVILGDKSLTVVGAGSGSTTITAHPTLTTNVDTGFAAAPVATEQRPVVLIEGSGRVDFRGICFDGNFAMPGNGRLVGLFFRNGADGLVENCLIKNCRANPLTGANGCAGIIVRGDNGADICNVMVRNCLVNEFGKAGAVAFFNANLQVEDSKVVGAGPVGFGKPAQLGVQISYDASGEVRNCTVTNLHYTDGSYTATGILIYDASGAVRIVDNSIGNCELGIYAGSVNNPFVTIVIRRNRIHCANDAVSLESIAIGHIEDNQFHASDSIASDVVSDNSNTNTWLSNSYSTYAGGPTHPIPGSTSVDPNPRRTVDLVGGMPSRTPLAGGHAPAGIVVGDFDGFGGDDFATIDQNNGLSISVGINNGAGFTVTNIVFAGATAAPIAIVQGEFNGLPGTDLAVITSSITPPATQNLVYVFRNVGATGAFALLTVTPLTGFTTATGLAAGDLNGDAITDLVATDGGNGGGGAALLINNGAGSFTVSALPGSFSNAVRGATIGEFNGDASNDVALIEGDFLTGRLHLLAGDGAGSFTAFGSSPLAISGDPTALANSDLDGDGDSDVLVGYGQASGGAVEVFDNDGTGAFSVTRYKVDNSVTAIAVGNLDKDSDPDTVRGDAAVVNFTGGSVTVLGSYEADAGFGAGGIAATGGSPSGVAFGDFDGNNFPDLFYCDASGGEVVVLIGKPQANTQWFGTGCAGTRARIPFLRTSGVPSPTQPNSTFGLKITNAKPAALSAVMIALAPAGVLIPCAPQIDPASQLFAWLLVTDITGEASVGLALATTPVIAGLPVFCEAIVLDPAAPLLFGGPISLSRGMMLRFGY